MWYQGRRRWSGRSGLGRTNILAKNELKKNKQKTRIAD
jgi:hypothetical protein